MSNNRKREAGFSGVETLIVLVILGLLSGAGWLVYKNHSANSITQTSTKQTQAPQTSDPYTGWKSYTLQYEKLTLKYPPSWAIDNESTCQQDIIIFTATDNFSFTIVDGIQNGGDEAWPVTSDPVAVQYLGKLAYLVFISNSQSPQADGPPVPGTSSISSAILLGDAKNQASLFKDKNVLGGSQYDGVNGPEGSYTSIGMGYGGKNNLPIQKAKIDKEYKNGLLVIQSAHY